MLRNVVRKLKKIIRSQFGPIRMARLERSDRNQTKSVATDFIQFLGSVNSKEAGRGGVIDGDWDLQRTRIDELEFHQACVEVLSSGSHWSGTDFFRNEVRRIDAGTSERGLITEDELRKWLAGIEEAYASARSTGELVDHAGLPRISVNIWRHGEFLVQSGLEQLIIARLLEIPSVRVEILARHPDWVKFRKEICAVPRGAYSPLLHPDLQWIPSRRVSHDRWDIIRRELIADEGSVLDIGCYWGYFCERFESLGFRCTGVEVDPKNFYFLEKLRRANNCQFDAVNMSIFDFIGDTPREFDVVLALAVFHWFLKNKDSCTKLERMLGNLRTREFFFMPHSPTDATMQGAYWNPSEDEFADFVMESAGLSSKRLLGYVPHGSGRRSLYQLTP